MENLSAEEKLLFSSIKINANDNDYCKLNTLLSEIHDWNYAEKLLLENNAAQFLYKKLPFLSDKNLIPESILANIKQAYLHTFRLNFLLYEEFSKITEVFAQNSIFVIPLKGIYLAEKLYNDIGLRKMSDIDLLTSENDAQKCIEILAQNGYISDNYKSETPEERMIHFPAMRQGEISIEIKSLLNKHQGNLMTEEEIFARLQPISLNQTQCYELEINDLLIFICLHAAKHFYSGYKMNFTSLYDIANILSTRKINWREVEDKCLKYRCTAEVFNLISLVAYYFDIDIQEVKSNNLENDSIYLINYLRNRENQINSGHYINTLNSFTTFKSKIQYIFSKLLFPSYNYVQKRYNVRHKFFVFIFYPYRWYLAVKSLLFMQKQ
ncbi:MAG: nucleotidyltransferase family protein [Paludibacter sp.]|jgi:hypothetical protein|nr:nucleotidyltransferase family protein [Paludibacter sp.]